MGVVRNYHLLLLPTIMGYLLIVGRDYSANYSLMGYFVGRVCNLLGYKHLLLVIPIINYFYYTAVVPVVLLS